MQATAERARTNSRLWALVPMGGMLLIAAAVYERLPAHVKPPHVYILCREPGSLTLIFSVIALVLVVAGLGCAIGVLHLVVDPPARIAAPLAYGAIALAAVVGADGLDHIGAGVAVQTQARYEHAPADICEYPMPAYQETPGWFF
ncbi:hypothetical protein [Kitasatospora camelliae]|uniref:DUF1648 domain-containing protein n=1 Tax=Kitasatospora camelliae TaxID=3156397 RepID=A0AAU8K3Y6_9ACTN